MFWYFGEIKFGRTGNSWWALTKTKSAFMAWILKFERYNKEFEKIDWWYIPFPCSQCKIMNLIFTPTIHWFMLGDHWNIYKYVLENVLGVKIDGKFLFCYHVATINNAAKHRMHCHSFQLPLLGQVDRQQCSSVFKGSHVIYYCKDMPRG